MNNSYDTFAPDYDEFGPIADYLGDEKRYFERLFRTHNVQTVLDCACGTGQHLYMLSELGRKDYNRNKQGGVQMNHLPHITESEWAVISKLWEESPLTIVEIVKRVQADADKKLAPTTIKTLLRRLIAKKAVDFTVDEKNSKLYYYFPLLTEQDCVVQQSEHFLSLYFKDNIEKLFSTFVDNFELSDKEIDNLKEILNKKKQNSNG